jgi:hypothetical protein
VRGRPNANHISRRAKRGRHHARRARSSTSEALTLVRDADGVHASCHGDVRCSAPRARSACNAERCKVDFDEPRISISTPRVALSDECARSGFASHVHRRCDTAVPAVTDWYSRSERRRRRRGPRSSRHDQPPSWVWTCREWIWRNENDGPPVRPARTALVQRAAVRKKVSRPMSILACANRRRSEGEKPGQPSRVEGFIREPRRGRPPMGPSTPTPRYLT